MPVWFDRLTPKLTILVVLFAALMGGATAAIVTHGFRQTEHTATERSAAGLKAQGRDALLALTQREAQVTAEQFSRAGSAGKIAASYLVSASKLGTISWNRSLHLTREPGGQYGDRAAGRLSDIFVPAAPRVNPRQLDDLRDSSALDALFPGLLKQVQDATSLYFIGPSGVGRYYPPTGISQLLRPDYNILQDPSYTAVLPQADPGRATVWRAPYVNPQLTGVQVTASTPIYDGNTFRGAIAVDVSLTGLLNHLATLKPTATGYAFLVDHNGRLIAAPPSDLGDLLGPDVLPAAISPVTILGLSLTSAPGLSTALHAMRAGQSGVHDLTLGNRQVFLSYASVVGLGWSLGLVAPIGEITAQSAAVDSAIQHDATATIVSTLAALGICFAVVLLLTLIVSRWVLVRPITTLTAATQAIAGGDLNVTIPVRGRDEVAQLATSFNAMTTVLAHFYDVLEQRVRERTHELSTLLDVSRNVTSTLELAPLLELILDQLQSMVDFTSATIITLDGEQLEVLEYRGPAPHDVIVGLRLPLEEGQPHFAVVRGRAPLIVSDVGRDTPFTRAFRRETGVPWGESYGEVRSWMGVPLILKEQVIGMLVVIHTEPDFYTDHHGQLATVIAAQAAVAIENANLYAQAQEFAAYKERSRLARELHDSVSQALYGIALGARTARTLLRQSPERAGEPLDYVLSLAEAGLAEMRALIFELRPESLETEGLVAALDHQAAALRARHGIRVQTALGTEHEAPFGAKEAIYRIALEALHNAVKHARAGTIDIALEWGEEDLRLRVDDDGQGFDPGGSFPGHLGLQSMRERAAALGGWLKVTSAPAHGTHIEARIPW